MTQALCDLTGQLLFLGTGTSVGVPVIGCDCPVCVSADPQNHRLRCSILLGLPEGTLLVDTSPDLRTQFLRERVGVAHALLYTHSHADHLFGLDDVRLFPLRTGKPLPVYCEQEVEDRIRKSYDYAFDNRGYGPGAAPQLEMRRIGLDPFEALGATIIPLRLKHGRFDVLGFRFGDVAYCTDTNLIPEETLERMRGLDTLILDALRPRPHPTHYSLDEAIAMARRIGARRTLFTHISHELEHAETNASLPSDMRLAHDGLRIPLTESGKSTILSEGGAP